MRALSLILIPVALAGVVVGQLASPVVSSGFGLPSGNIVGIYDFIQGSDATKLYDRSGNGRHGTLGAGAAAPTWSNGGLTFAGAQTLSVPTALADSTTQCLAFRFTSIPAASTLLGAPTGGPSVYTTSSKLNMAKAGCCNIAAQDSTYVKFDNANLPGWQFLAAVKSGTTLKFYLNGKDVTTSVSNQTLGSISTMNIGSDPGPANLSHAVIAYYVSYARLLSLAETEAVRKYVDSRLSARGIYIMAYNYIFDGDSLTLGGGLTITYPNRLIGNYPSGQAVSTNLGVNGETVATMLTNATTAVDPKITSASYGSTPPNSGIRRNVVFEWGGDNDLNTSADPTTLYNNIVSYCQGRRTAGAKVVVTTILPRTSGGVPGTYETSRQTVNANIRANWPTFADALSDPGGDPTIGCATCSNNNTYYQGDGTHLNDAGSIIMVGLSLKAVQSIVW